MNEHYYHSLNFITILKFQIIKIIEKFNVYKVTSKNADKLFLLVYLDNFPMSQIILSCTNATGFYMFLSKNS
jgi:hypothetical protein